MKTLLRYLFGAGKAAKTNAITIDGRPWYMAQDVCDWLGIKCAHVATTKKNEDSRDDIAEEEHRKETIHVAGSGYKKVILVNNKGLIKLIHQSNTPEALEVQARVLKTPAKLTPPEWAEYVTDA